jgi:hypothetical protein
MSRIRFTNAQQIFEAFPAAAEDIRSPRDDDDALEFAFRLLRSSEPIEAVAYFAYLLPRREAVWWGAQCVRALRGRAAPDAALSAAEDWVRVPEETQRRAALDVGTGAPKRVATTWLALAAGWSGGNIASQGNARAKPHLTAKAVRAAIILALAQAAVRDPTPWIAAFVEAAVRFVKGGDATPAPQTGGQGVSRNDRHANEPLRQ